MQVGWQRPRVLRAAVFGLAFAVALVTWLVTRNDGKEAGGGEGPRIVSVQELTEIAAGAGYPVFWAGEIPGRELQLTETSEGLSLSYVKELGEEPALTVVSYPDANASSSLEGFANQSGSSTRSANGREVIVNVEEPANVYFASEDDHAQVEVLGAPAKRVMELALSSQVQPIG